MNLTMPFAEPVAEIASAPAPESLPVTDDGQESASTGKVLIRASQGVLASLILHTLLLIALSVVVFVDPESLGLSIHSGFAEADAIPFEDGMELRMSMPAGDAPPAEVLPSPLTDLSGKLPSLQAGSELMSGTGEGDQSAGGEGKNLGDEIGLPSLPGAPQRAVIKGSFAAWTIPHDPAPLENYQIVIQIKLPMSAKNYRANDLSGGVVGSDKYKQPIHGRDAEMVRGKDGLVHLIVAVPGGGRKVRDTITIHSKLLKERQTLYLEF